MITSLDSLQGEIVNDFDVFANDERFYAAFATNVSKINGQVFDLQTYLSHIEGKGIGYNTGYTTLGGLLFHKNSYVQPFIDLRTHYFNDNRTALNLGAGLRFLSDRFHKIFGVNFFYDYRHTWKNYHQLGMGLELLGMGCDWLDMRFNFYLPIGDKSQHCCSKLFTYPGGFFALAKKRQKTLRGLDFEIETRLSRFVCVCDFDLYFAAGAYYYRSSCRDNIVGAKGRVGFQYLNCINLEFRASYDPTFKENFQGLISFTYDFGCFDCKGCDPECCWFDCLFTRPVQRQEIIVLDKKRCFFETNF